MSPHNDREIARYVIQPLEAHSAELKTAYRQIAKFRLKARARLRLSRVPGRSVRPDHYIARFDDRINIFAFRQPESLG